MKSIFLIISLFTTLFSYSQTGWYDFEEGDWIAGNCDKHGIVLWGIPACNNGSYNLVFEDNFDGNTLDQTKWIIENGVNRDFSFHQEKQWFQSENIVVSNGTLKIIADEFETPYYGEYLNFDNNPATVDNSYFKYSSGEIKTTESFYYGKYEIRCRLPVGQGFWPAFWSFGGPGWNEIDFFEMHGDDIDRFTCNVLHDYDFDTESEMCSLAIDDAADFSQWHVITCIFEFDKITWFLDGVEGPTYHRYSTVDGNSISCGENVANGTYFEESSFPTEPMNIRLNMSLHYPDGQPNATTPFPSAYEIDYVRFYVQDDVPQTGSCDGCIDHIIYENTDNLPSITRTSNFIIAGENTVVKNNQFVKLEAENYIDITALEIELGGVLTTNINTCNYASSEDVDVEWNENALEGYQIVQCVNPIYEIDAVGIFYFECEIQSLSTQLVYSNSGEPISNKIVSWDASNVATGWYEVHLKLFNCNGILEYIYNVLVFDACNKNLIDNGTIDNFQILTDVKRIDSNDESNLDESQFTIYPNPTKNDLHVYCHLADDMELSLCFYDIEGKVILKEEKFKGSMGDNVFSLDLSVYAEGTYFLKIVSEEKVLFKKVIISK